MTFSLLRKPYVASFALIPALLVAKEAHAQEKPKADLAIFITPEISTIRLFGENQELTSWSIGGHLRQGLSLGPWTTSLRIGGDAFLTYQEAPPLQRGLRTFMTNFSTGAKFNFGVTRLTANAEYAMMNLSGNPLDQTIGAASRYHLVGGSVSAGFTGMSPIIAEIRVTGWHWLNTVEPTQSIQISISIGMEAIIKR